MRTLLKSLGGIILLGGVGTLTVQGFSEIHSNTILGVGLCLVVVGYLAHIILNKKFE